MHSINVLEQDTRSATIEVDNFELFQQEEKAGVVKTWEKKNCFGPLRRNVIGHR